MKYLKLYENFSEESINKICEKYGITNYVINEDGSIDVNGDVNLWDMGMKKIILKFRNVSGYFNCSFNDLTSLEGCPESVGGDFYCHNNKLTSLKHCPEVSNGIFDCSENQLTSLEGCPKLIYNFNCDHNNLESLKFSPKYSNEFSCENNRLTSLEFAPTTNDFFSCNYNQLTSLEFMPKSNIFYCDDNNIIDFIGFLEPSEHFYCDNNPIYHIFNLFNNYEQIELLYDYDCIRGKDIVIDRLNMFLEEIDKPTVKSIDGYNNIQSMKYIKLFENFNEESIHSICKKYSIENYSINEDGSIDVNGDVNISYSQLSKIPLNFRNVTGFFNCSYNELTSLEEFPISVGGDFKCSHNKLTSLEGSPKSVGGNFTCSSNKLTSLEDGPKSVGGNFYCRANNIRDFIGFIEPIGNFICNHNPIHNIWILFENKEHIELLNDYDCIRGNDIVIDRLNMFLEEIDKPTVKSVYEYNNI